MQERGLPAYIAELVGTFFLVFAIGMVVTLFVATSEAPQLGSDFAVVGLVHGFVLFALVAILGAVSGGHFNPAITLGAFLSKKISLIDTVVYWLAQLSGGVLGALLIKGLLLDEGRAGGYGAATISPMLGGNLAGGILEMIGTFLLVLAVAAVAFNPKARQEWAPLVIGLTLGVVVMIMGPLTGGSVNPARWFGPALVSGEWGGVWPYVAGPLVGGALAAFFYKFIIAPRHTQPAPAPTQPSPLD